MVAGERQPSSAGRGLSSALSVRLAEEDLCSQVVMENLEAFWPEPLALLLEVLSGTPA